MIPTFEGQVPKCDINCDFVRPVSPVKGDHNDDSTLHATVDMMATHVTAVRKGAPSKLVTESPFSEELCGANRPGHFTGVLTVVMKLLNIVKPSRAYFGKKNYQQFLLIRDMCAAFFVDVEIVGCETVRECDGLTMSSRNKLLNKAARGVVHRFNQALLSAPSGEQGDALVASTLESLGLQVDYVETRQLRRFGAIVVGCGNTQVRLIDNVKIPDLGGGSSLMEGGRR